MPQNKSYEEHEPGIESPLGEFLCWLFIIGVGAPMSYGWVLVNIGLISNATLFAACGGLGGIVGLKAAWGTARDNRARRKAAALSITREGGREGQQNRKESLIGSIPERQAAPLSAGRNCEAFQTPSNVLRSDSSNALAEARVAARRRVRIQGLL